MMRFAKIKNGKVENIVEADDPIDGYESISANANEIGIGDNFSNGEFSKAIAPQSWSRDPLLNRVRAARCYALNAVAGILTTALATTPVDHALIDACKVARQSLLDMTKTPASMAATSDAELIAAQVAAYSAIVAAAPVALQNAFAEMHL